MTFVAAVLLGLGLVDLARWSPEAASVRREVVALVVGAVVLVALAVSVGAGARSATALAAVGIGASAVWVVSDTAPLRRGGRTPLAVLVAVAVVLVVLLPAAPPIAGPLQRWYLASGGGGAPTRTGLREVVGGGAPAVQALTALAGVLFVLCTGNRVVRLVLACAGSPPASGEAALKGGRLLGPLERLFILGLALAGDLTAAAVVIAAKGVLRLPEIRTAREERRGGADTVTEYFLVGTFTSWLLAVGVAALVVLAG